MNNIKTYTKTILLPLLIGGIVGFIIAPFMDYPMLEKPPFAPPGILFPIVWTILYFFMGVSYAILKTKGLTDEATNKIYYQQLAINSLWPIIFFLFKWRLFAFVWILLLDVAIVIMIKRFYEKNKTAGLLQVPYLIWSLFATYLTLAMYLLNR